MNFKAGICTLIGMAGSFLSSLFGGWSYDMQTLSIFMAADIITGLIVAGVFSKSTKTFLYVK